MSRCAGILSITQMYNQSMNMVRDNKFVRTDIWSEGKWLDLWSVVHLLSGVSIGFGFYFLNLGNIFTALSVLVLLVLYEGWEMYVRIEEAPTNRFMDVVVGMVGFVPAFYFVAPLFSFSMLVLVFLFTLAFNIALSVLGWRASLKAEALKKRLQDRYSVRFAKLLERRAKLQKRFGRHKKI